MDYEWGWPPIPRLVRRRKQMKRGVGFWFAIVAFAVYVIVTQLIIFDVIPFDRPFSKTPATLNR
jgi:hypothetical protein